MASTPSLQSLIDQFVTDLSNLTKRAALEQVLASLGGEAAPAPARRAPRAQPAVPQKKKGGGKRSSEDMDAMREALLAHVHANPGQRGEQIAAALGTDVGTMRLPMRKLIAERKVRTEGQRRGMTYYPAGGGGGGSKGPKRGPKAAKKVRAKGKVKAKPARKTKGKGGRARAKGMITPMPKPVAQAPAELVKVEAKGVAMATA